MVCVCKHHLYLSTSAILFSVAVINLHVCALYIIKADGVNLICTFNWQKMLTVYN